MGRYHVATAVAAIALIAGQAGAQVCVGNCGAGVANGDVVAPPNGPTYQYVSTFLGVDGNNLGGLVTNAGGGSATNGSTLLSALFGATSGQNLQFYFNYVTTDGSQYADYGWARLLNADMTTAAWLVTARTRPDGSIIPGSEMPGVDATLVPPSVPIIDGGSGGDGGPVWLAIGEDSGDCFSGVGNGCGQTGWVQSNYTIGLTGNYFLQFGVANWLDTGWDSALGFAGATIGGVVIPTDNTVPEPGTLVLLASGLAALIPRIRRSLKKH